MPPAHLDGLNNAQLRAVQHPPNIPLQILAGPGSGKTKVLTSRIVHLITEHAISPANICAVTFTNKAALEMRTRLGRMLTKEQVRQIKMGTFHALCAQFLRKYATLVGINGNFTVCDADESKKILGKMLKEPDLKNFLKNCSITLSEGTVSSRISQAKAKGFSPHDLLDTFYASSHASTKGKAKAKSFLPLTTERLEHELNSANIKETIDFVVAHLYDQYELTLREHNSLDFDDLLVYGVRLFSENPQVGRWCTHALVDEFQDTNSVQYELMRGLAATSRCVTIVGDPDQSIYGWRSAEVENLAKMRRDFATTQQIFLEENYRSTAAILAVSVAVVAQDKSRIKKTLHATHPQGPQPTLHCFPSDQIEASAIAHEVKRVVAHMGGALGYDDFAILLRYNSLSRVFEGAFRRAGVPTRLLGGARFFERAEVRDVLAYLQLADNPAYAPAFARAVNVPPRGLGAKSVAELLAAAARRGCAPLALVEGICAGRVPDIRPPVRRKVGEFVAIVKELRELAEKGTSPASLIRCILTLVRYQEYLQKTQEDADSRWQNVQELINFATETDERGAESFDIDVEDAAPPADEDDWDDRGEDEYDEEELDDLGFAEVKPKEDKPAKKSPAAADIAPETPLRAFLQASMLSTDTQQNTEDDKDKQKVTITTCHAAKGLEWPVVFIPVVEEGVFPSARAEDPEEERRLLYVACTRAHALLYLTHAASRKMAGETLSKRLSEFVSALPGVPPPANADSAALFARSPPALSPAECTTLARVLHRAPPDAAQARAQLAALAVAGTPSLWTLAAESAGTGFASAAAWERGAHERETHPPLDAAPVFVSARNLPLQPLARAAYAPPPARSPSPPEEASVPSSSSGSGSGSGKVASARAPRAKAGSKAGAKAANAAKAEKAEKEQPGAPRQATLESFMRRKEPRPATKTVVDVPVAAARSAPKSSSVAATLRPATGQAKPAARALPSSGSSSPDGPAALPAKPAAAALQMPGGAAGAKRRLGMGRAAGGYPNKKFKTPGGA
ncbi:UvrD-helicase-domain-containing protein [Phanerochaete sordida]|uniref:DNA 3'-5' helicase n=1 Tax=Phanerochaete sordida TaxID=48140 RepID=A0A9P3G6E5_9APHY|nr:UvrD-helicase-domain-containing protein [Phanerochaete sordida]